MCVRRIEPVRKIFWPAIREKEALAPEIIAAAKRGLGLRHKLSAQSLCALCLCGEFVFDTGIDSGSHALNDPRQTRQQKRAMKIVGPTLITIYSVRPRPIVPLSPHHITCGAHSPID